MRVRCSDERPSADEIAALNGAFYGSAWTPLREGAEYLVYGMQFHHEIVWFELLSAGETWFFLAPARLFEFLDPRVSSLWRLGKGGDGAVVLWPEVFFEPAFHEQLSDDDPVALAKLSELTRALRGTA